MMPASARSEAWINRCLSSFVGAPSCRVREGLPSSDGRAERPRRSVPAARRGHRVRHESYGPRRRPERPQCGRISMDIPDPVDDGTVHRVVFANQGNALGISAACCMISPGVDRRAAPVPVWSAARRGRSSKPPHQTITGLADPGGNRWLSISAGGGRAVLMQKGGARSIPIEFDGWATRFLPKSCCASRQRRKCDSKERSFGQVSKRSAA